MQKPQKTDNLPTNYLHSSFFCTTFAPAFRKCITSRAPESFNQVGFRKCITSRAPKNFNFWEEGATAATPNAQSAFLVASELRRGVLAHLARARHWQCRGERFESAILHEETAARLSLFIILLSFFTIFPKKAKYICPCKKIVVPLQEICICSYAYVCKRRKEQRYDSTTIKCRHLSESGSIVGT